MWLCAYTFICVCVCVHMVVCKRDHALGYIHTWMCSRRRMTSTEYASGWNFVMGKPCVNWHLSTRVEANAAWPLYCTWWLYRSWPGVPFELWMRSTRWPAFSVYHPFFLSLFFCPFLSLSFSVCLWLHSACLSLSLSFGQWAPFLCAHVGRVFVFFLWETWRIMDLESQGLKKHQITNNPPSPQPI